MTQKPILRVSRIHIRNLRGLREARLPEQGLGWQDEIPSVVLMGGINGSGKTTLLECLARATDLLVRQDPAIPEEVGARECRVDYLISDGVKPPIELRFLLGDEAFVAENSSENTYGYQVTGRRARRIQTGAIEDLRRTLKTPQRYAKSTWPRLAYLPSEKRDLVVPHVKYKSPGKLEDSGGFVSWWQRPTDGQWSGTTIELLFSARWADLNAREEGVKTNHFKRYSAGFRLMTGGAKELGWTTSGDLVIKLRSGGTHPVQSLSSGERHVLLLLAELWRLWRPGSLILIDEPELHLHDAWQTKLYEALLAMQKKRGGQIILATQSHHLFSVGNPGTTVLLGAGDLR